jgi:hypothetical protein
VYRGEILQPERRPHSALPRVSPGSRGPVQESSPGRPMKGGPDLIINLSGRPRMPLSSSTVCYATPASSVHTRLTCTIFFFLHPPANFFQPSGGIGALPCTMTSRGAGGSRRGAANRTCTITIPAPAYFYPNLAHLSSSGAATYATTHTSTSTTPHTHTSHHRSERAVRTHSYIIGSSYIHVHTYTNSHHLSFLSVGARVSSFLAFINFVALHTHTFFNRGFSCHLYLL